MTTVILIRHGETLWNQERRYQGQLDSPLTEQGLRQARLTARYLQQFPLDAVYSSDLARAARTAEIIAKSHGLAIETDPRLREMSFGVWEGLTRHEVVEKYPEVYYTRYHDILTTRVPGGELPAEVAQRFRTFLKERLPGHCGKTIALVSHGACLRLALAEFLEMPLRKSYCLRLSNAGVSILTYTGRKDGCLWEIKCINSTGHLV
ncbi:MAG TPA: histidine phosphatase family protein [Firmicutes bacterium]|nr:histidine phosphatase family protein [Bacillota bacterium]